MHVADLLAPHAAPAPVPDIHVTTDVLQNIHPACAVHTPLDAAAMTLTGAVLSYLDMDGINFSEKKRHKL